MTAGDPLRNAKVGIKLEESGRRIPRLFVPSKMRQSGDEAAISRREIGVLPDGLPGCSKRLIAAAETDECQTDSRQCRVKQWIDRAQAHRTLEALDCLLGLPCIFISPASLLPGQRRARVQRDRTIHHLPCSSE